MVQSLSVSLSSLSFPSSTCYLFSSLHPHTHTHTHQLSCTYTERAGERNGGKRSIHTYLVWHWHCQAIYICFSIQHYFGKWYDREFERTHSEDKAATAAAVAANGFMQSSTTSKITKLKLDGIRDEHEQYKCVFVCVNGRSAVAWIGRRRAATATAQRW